MQNEKMAPAPTCENLTVILPAYNEGQVIGRVVAAVREECPGAEVIVVDDGSTDETAARAAEAGATVVSHPYNIGNGAAVKAGLRRAGRPWALLMDGDGQHNPKDIARLLAEAGSFEMVVGARRRESQSSPQRAAANAVYNLLASYVTGFRVEDLTSGFRLLQTATARAYLALLPNTFSYPTTMTMSYLRSGRSVGYVPIRTEPRLGKSKIRPLKDGSRFLLIILKIATLFSPLRVFLPVSLFFMLTGALYYAYTFVTQHRFTNMSALLLSTAVIIFMIGLVSEQVSQMRHERGSAE